MPVRKVNKEEVVTEALKLFRSRGYHKTTMARSVQPADCSKEASTTISPPKKS